MTITATITLDELRVQGVAHSDDWLWVEYLNMASKDVVAAYGGVEQAGKVKE